MPQACQANKFVHSYMLATGNFREIAVAEFNDLWNI